MRNTALCRHLSEVLALLSPRRILRKRLCCHYEATSTANRSAYKMRRKSLVSWWSCDTLTEMHKVNLYLLLHWVVYTQWKWEVWIVVSNAGASGRAWILVMPNNAYGWKEWRSIPMSSLWAWLAFLTHQRVALFNLTLIIGCNLD